MKYEKLTPDLEAKTRIYAGHVTFTIDQLEQEIKEDSEIGKKLRNIEKELEKY